MNAQVVLLQVVAALNDGGIAYMLVGSFASNYYGIVRSTQDADFLLQVDEMPAARLQQSLGSAFVLDPQAALETFTFGTYYTLRHADSDFAVDLFILKGDPHDQLSFSRRVQASCGEVCVFIPTPEDLVVTKLRWSQGGRRNKDIDDVRNVLAVQQGRLDLAYIRHWCDQHGTREILETLLADTPTL